MITDKRMLQWCAAIATSVLILVLGAISGYSASSRLEETLERQLAEDSRVISENLRIIIGQVTREIKGQREAIDQVQEVLQNARTHGWRGFACVVDKDGTVVAHPNPDMRGATVSLESYSPSTLAGPPPVKVFDLPGSGDRTPPGVYKSSSDIIAVQWLPDLMTYLCVHQPQGEVRLRSERLLGILIRIGAAFVVVAAAGTWFFVGWLIDRYESSLEVSEARSSSLVENSESILVLDGNGQLLHANPAAVKLLDLEADSGTLGDLHPSDLKGLSTLIADSRSGARTSETELDLRTSGGRVVPVEVRACQITYHDQEATYLLLRDVTESRHAREEILAANRKLKELDRLKSDFLNTVSHELRTPLTSIKWSTESLSGLNESWDKETFEKLLRIIREDNKRLTSLIEQLLSFSRLDAGQLAPKFEPVELKDLSEKAILELSPIADAKQIRVSLSGSPVTVSADREQIRLVMTNLIDNAIKYSRTEGPITVEITDHQSHAILSVKDSGIGINNADINSIFDRFFRSDAPEVRDEAGTGLGLSIVRGILDTHSGSIDVTSTQGQGSEFRVSLPTTQKLESS
jgi:PAS domain S-box-containing protein